MRGSRAVPVVLPLLAVPVFAQERTDDPPTRQVAALVAEFLDPVSTEREVESAGARILAFGPVAAVPLAEAALRQLRGAHGEAGMRLLGSMRESAAPAVALLIEASRDHDPAVRLAALEVLGDVGPYVPGFDPAVIPQPEPAPRGFRGHRGDVETRAWERIQVRCDLEIDTPTSTLVEILGRTVVELDRLDMAVELLASRGAAARDALPVLRELRMRGGFRRIGAGRWNIEHELFGRVVGAVVRVAPVARESLPDYDAALCGWGFRFVPEADRIAAANALGHLGTDGVSLARRVITQCTEPAVVLAAVRSLERIGPPAADALPDLEEIAATEDEDARVRDAAERAIARIRDR